MTRANSAVSATVLVAASGIYIAETGPTAKILGRPAHPYTERLIEALPSVTRRVAELPVIEGRPPTLSEPLPPCISPSERR